MSETVSVVVVNCNAAQELDRCLDALHRSDPAPHEIILVDNGSSDSSLEVAGRHAEVNPQLKIISLPENRGLNAARNEGIAAASGDIVAFVDNDATVRPNWIKGGLNVMSQLDAEAVQCKLLLEHDPELIDSVGYLIGPFGFPRHIVRPGTRDDSDFNSPRILFGAKGAGMMFKRSLLLRVGGFDPSYFLYGDETDLFWRIFRAGGVVAYAPDSIILHAAGGTQRNLTSIGQDLLYREGTRNYIRMIAKNQHPRRVWSDVIGQTLIWSGIAIYQLLRGRAAAGKLIFKGIGQALRELPHIRRERSRASLPFKRVPQGLKAPLTLSYIRQLVRAI